jgi:CRP/FNR family transcriptional regulator
MNNTVFSELKINCTNCKLKQLCIPRGLSKHDIDNLSTLVQNSTLIHKGEYLYRQGDSFNGLIAINTGSAKLISVDSQGGENLINLILPGELIGFDGVAGSFHQCSARALETVNYCRLTPDNLDILCEQSPHLMHQNAPKKLAHFFLNLSERLTQRGFSATQFNLTLNRQELALLLKLTPETISRLFNQLQKEHIIRVKGKSIEITDLQQLKSLASQ